MRFKINTQLLLDLFISGILTLFSMKLISFFIPDGVTLKFLIRALKIIVFISLILGVIFIIFLIFDKNFKFKKKIEFPRFSDFALIALPMSPVFDFAIINTQYLNFTSFFYLIGITLLFSFVFSFILPILFSYLASLKILMISGLSLSFTILTMAKISGNPTNHIFNSQFLTQGTYLILSFIILYLIYSFNKKVAYTVIFFFLATGIIVNYINYNTNNTKEVSKSDRLINFLSNKKNKIIKKKISIF